MLEGCRARGLRVTMSTNGSRLQVMGRIMESYRDVCTLGISINRDPGPGLSRLIAEQQPLLKSLFRKGPWLQRTVQAMPGQGTIPYYVIYPDVMTGNNHDGLPFPRFVSELRSLQQTCSSRVEPVFCSGFLPNGAAYPELHACRCPAGTTKLAILPDGSVYPCNLFFGFMEYRLGNIFTDDFEKIWVSPQLAFFRKYAGNLCPAQDCELHTECHGGCPAHSLKFFNRLDGPDPRCIGIDGQGPGY